MQPEHVDIDRSFFIAQRAIELMKTYGSSADPRSYEVWYTYVSGHKPAMNDEIKKLTAERGSLKDADIERLYEEHLAATRAARDTEKASNLMLGEIDQVMDMIDAALGSTSPLRRIAAGVLERSCRSRRPQPHPRPGRHRGARHPAGDRDEPAPRIAPEGNPRRDRNPSRDARLRASRGDYRSGYRHRQPQAFSGHAAQVRRGGDAGKSSLALIVIDIDHFKRFNDLYGHLTGDQVLRLVSMTMREQVKSKATLARFGGEEFGIIMPETSLADARAVAEEIRQSVLNRELVKRSTGESLGKITVSVGVSEFRHGETGTALLIAPTSACTSPSARDGTAQ